MIELDGVSKLYGSVIGVNDINLSLDAGAYGLLGPNGSGKTTLINLILGQIRPTMGQVKLFGKNPWRRSKLLSRVGLCPAIEFSYPRVTSLEWVTYMVRMHGFSQRDSVQRARSALEEVRLDHVWNRPMTDYSLGMRQRAKIAQAIAHEPELLIFDEPFNGLDPVGRFEMTNLLKDWVAQGRSLMLASHILHEVEAVEPSFLLISSGRLMASGGPDEMRRILAEAPNTLVIRSSDSSRLAGYLAVCDAVKQVRFLGDDTLEIETLSAASVLDKLPQAASELGVVVHELTSSDESLKALFATLMKIHRGEINAGVMR